MKYKILIQNVEDGSWDVDVYMLEAADAQEAIIKVLTADGFAYRETMESLTNGDGTGSLELVQCEHGVTTFKPDHGCYTVFAVEVS